MKNWRLETTANDSITSLVNEIDALEIEVDNLKDEVSDLTDAVERKDERILELEQELHESRNQ